MADAGALDQIGQREALEDLAGLVRDADPHLLEHAVALAVVVLLHQRGQRTLDRGEDLGQRDLLGWPGEHVPAADAALRAHEPRALDRQEDLLQIGLGEGGALGDLFDRCRAV